MNSMEGSQMTSVVVRICRCGKDSIGPRSPVGMLKWDKTIYMIDYSVSEISIIEIRSASNHLDVQWTGHRMTDKEIRQRHLPGAASVQDSTEPAPEENDADYLHAPGPVPAPSAFGIESFLVQVDVRVDVEVEAGESHDDVKEFVLDGKEDLGEEVEFHGAFVI